MIDQAERLRWAQKAASELEMTEAAFERVRAALVDKMFSTPMEASAFRERIYGAVAALDQVREMVRQATYDTAMLNNESLLAQHGFTNPNQH